MVATTDLVRRTDKQGKLVLVLALDKPQPHTDKKPQTGRCYDHNADKANRPNMLFDSVALPLLGRLLCSFKTSLVDD